MSRDDWPDLTPAEIIRAEHGPPSGLKATCPQCRSQDLEHSHARLGSSKKRGHWYTCKGCGYRARPNIFSLQPAASRVLGASVPKTDWALVPSETAKGSTVIHPKAPTLITWESEVCAIGREAAMWTVETGGDLFGLADGHPVIYLATKAGPAAVRDSAHFRLDVDYLRELSSMLAGEWGLRYLGDWHSHHRLGLTTPSSGDRRRIRQVAARNSFASMAEVIVTFDPGGSLETPSVRVHPCVYYGDVLSGGRLCVLRGVSPIREALIARRAVPDQELDRWHDMAIDRMGGIVAAENDGLQQEGLRITDLVRQPLVDHAIRALQEASGSAVERHQTPFGWILAVPVDDSGLIGLAVDGVWPCRVLEVDWIDRERGAVEAIDLNLAVNLLVPADVVALYRRGCELRRSKEGGPHVDSTTT